MKAFEARLNKGNKNNVYSERPCSINYGYYLENIVVVNIFFQQLLISLYYLTFIGVVSPNE